MDQQTLAYQNARQRVLDAQANMPAGWRPVEGVDPPAAVVELAAASKALRAAELPLAAEIDVAWRANQQAVQSAKQAVAAAMREQARVEVEAADAARARNPARPVLSVDELDRCRAAAAETGAAKADLVVAQQHFKAGVTAEQIQAVR